MTLLERIRILIEKYGQIKGEKWINNVLSDCMATLEESKIYTEYDFLKEIDRIPQNIPVYIREYFQKQIEKSWNLNFSNLNLFADEREVSNNSILVDTKVNSIKKLHSAHPKRNIQSKPAGRIGSKDQPVTFRNKVKSSGYTAAPAAAALFHLPKSSNSKPRQLISSKSIKSIPTCSYAALINLEELPLSVKHASAISSVKFHPSGKLLASGSADRVCRFYKTSAHSAAKICKDWSGHNGAVTNIFWGLNAIKSYGHILISSSRDGKARIWSTERADPVLEFAQDPAKADFKNASFYYKDKFAIMSSRDVINVYNYHLEEISSSEIKPALNYNTHKLVKTLKCSGQSVTSLSCINANHSFYIFTASSDKTIEIWDMNTGKTARRIVNAHSKPIHNFALPDYLSNSNNNCFVSAAVTDSIKLWDIRENHAIMHLQGHVNRYVNIETCISPCGTYIASGSEDNHAYVYDIRMGLISYKTKGNHGDCVTSVAFNPIKPELITGCSDGKLRAFSA